MSVSIKQDQVKKLSINMIKKIHKKLPDDTELEIALLGMTFIPSYIIYDWYKMNILPFKKEIISKNVEFLKQGNKSDDNIQIINIIKKVWELISDDLKNQIWINLNIIIKLLN